MKTYVYPSDWTRVCWLPRPSWQRHRCKYTLTTGRMCCQGQRVPLQATWPESVAKGNVPIQLYDVQRNTSSCLVSCHKHTHRNLTSMSSFELLELVLRTFCVTVLTCSIIEQEKTHNTQTRSCRRFAITNDIVHQCYYVESSCVQYELFNDSDTAM